MTDTNAIYAAINAVSQKVNDVLMQLDNFTLAKHKENREIIDESENGLIDIATILDEQNNAILELATLVSEVITTNNQEV